ncbi:excisionase family DNA-binding protein [Microvirga sp. BSC39]|uniref:excisionase family DNA-binding protein n=1 Tax=Microvirga sp. BSC39 TaxID=1549810 RepID=UPI00068C5FD3|nr:excisionase family DNA-binding protein [Microvirga sp. BSC39]
MGQDAMTTLSLREAAEQTGVSKSTIFRAIQAGRMSAQRDDDRNFKIDPAELFRAYPPKAPDSDVARDVAEQAATPPVGQGAPAPATDELRVRNAQLESEINALKTILENEKQRAEELREDRDRWAKQAERLALPAPVGAPAPRRGWWPFGKAS